MKSKHAVFLALTLLSGCARDTIDPHAQARRMRDDVNAVAAELSANAAYVTAICALRGDDAPTCKVLRGTYNVARATIIAAHRGIELYDAVGVGLEQTERAINEAHDAADRFFVAVDSVREVVSNEVAGHDPGPSQQPDRESVEEGEGSAPAGSDPAADPTAVQPAMDEGEAAPAAPDAGGP